MSDNLSSMLKQFEGLRLKPYNDSMGFMSIGYGRCLATNGINIAEAEMMLDNDIAAARMNVGRALTWTLGLDPVRQDILYCMAFQLGLNGLLQFSKMLNACRTGDYATAASEMLSSTWHSQTPARAEKLAQMMESGNY